MPRVFWLSPRRDCPELVLGVRQSYSCCNYWFLNTTNVILVNMQTSTSCTFNSTNQWLVKTWWRCDCKHGWPRVSIGQCGSIWVNGDQCGSMWVISTAESVWIDMGQQRSISVRMGQCGSISVNRDQYGSVLVNVDRYGSVEINIGQYWSMWINMYQWRSIWVSTGRESVSFSYTWPILYMTHDPFYTRLYTTLK